MIPIIETRFGESLVPIIDSGICLKFEGKPGRYLGMVVRSEEGEVRWVSIEYSIKRGYIKFEDLSMGEWFVYRDSICLKIEEEAYARFGGGVELILEEINSIGVVVVSVEWERRIGWRVALIVVIFIVFLLLRG